MNPLRILLDYTLFRLLILLATGIFFWGYCISSPHDILWLAIVFIVCVILGSIIAIFQKRMTILLAIIIYVTFFMLGGWLICYEQQSLSEDWPNKDAFYRGKIEDVELKGKQTLLTLLIDSTDYKAAGTWMTRRIDKRVLFYIQTDSLHLFSIGERLLVYTKIRRLEKQPSFLTFDYHRYLLNKGYSGLGYLRADNVLTTDTLSKLNTWKSRIRLLQHRISDYVDSWHMNPEVTAIVKTLSLGERGSLSDDVVQWYRKSGASHLLAISGLHIGILSAFLMFVCSPLNRLRKGRIWNMLVVNVILWSFALLSGGSPSVVRAVIMYNLYTLGKWCNEENSALFSLTLTAFILLLYHPGLLFDVSFQLSFLAVLSILLFMPPILQFEQLKLRNRWLRYLLNLILVSVTVQILVGPLTLYYFHSFPLYFLLTNLFAIPFSGVVMVVMMITFLLFPIPFIGNCAVWLLTKFVGLMNWVLQWISGLPYAQLELSSIDSKMLVFLLLCPLIILWLDSYRKKIIIGLLLLNIMCSYEFWIYMHPFPPSLYYYDGRLYWKSMYECTHIHVYKQLFLSDEVRIGVFNNAYWMNRKSSQRLSLDYAYITGTYRGEIAQLIRNFNIQQIILDRNLDNKQLNAWQNECKRYKIPYNQVNREGYYAIRF